jgi:spore coat protein CotH
MNTTFPGLRFQRGLHIVLCAIALLCSWTAFAAQEVKRPEGWSKATHTTSVKPDYNRLFSMDKVHEIRITITADRFRAMQDDLASIGPGGFLGFGGAGRGGLAFDPNNPAAALASIESSLNMCVDKPAASPCSIGGTAGECTALLGPGTPMMCMPAGMGNMLQGLQNGLRGGRGLGGIAPRMTLRDPIFAPVTVNYDGHVWTQVGMRYKGNSSLMAGNMGATGKIPFRLDFNHYQDEYPAIKGQRIYGFEKLTFSSNMSDDSQLREALATELFRDRGVPAARVAFYRVYVDAGSGPEYWGLYSMVEDPTDEAMLDTQFGNHDGNLYKPEGPGADWTFFAKEGFEKKNKQKKADYSDVEGAIAALNAPRDNPAAWRAALEARLDVEQFLKWLAVNTVMENWDTYGAIAHNYYLYGDQKRGGRLVWIPWDHNMSFAAGPGGGGMRLGGLRGNTGPANNLPPGGFNLPAGARGGLLLGLGGGSDVLHRQAGPGWPLIQRLMEDEVYSRRYRELLAHAMGGLFALPAFEKRAKELHALIASSVVGPNGEKPSHTTISSAQAFERSLDGPDGLISRVQRRQETVRAALAPPPTTK